MNSASFIDNDSVRYSVKFANYDLSMFIELGRDFDDGLKDAVSIYVKDRARNGTRSLMIVDPKDERRARHVLNLLPGITRAESDVLENLINAWLSAARFMLTREKQHRENLTSADMRIHDLRKKLARAGRERL